MKSVFLAYMIEVVVPLIVKDKSFSPQKSKVSLVSVCETDTVSLKVYFERLVTLEPAKAIKFSTIDGTIVMAVFKHGSTAVNTKFELLVGAVLAGLKL